MKQWRVKRLHTALRQSLNDLRKVERNKKQYRVDMGVLHSVVDGDSVCMVCLAGARMVGLGLPQAEEFWFDGDRTDQNTDNMLRAMDALRVGHVGNALRGEMSPDMLGGNTPHPLNRVVPDYHNDRRGWWRAMWKLQRDLEKARL